MVHLNEGALNLLFLNLLSHFTGFWTSKQIYCIAYNCCWMYFFVLICVFGLVEMGAPALLGRMVSWGVPAIDFDSGGGRHHQHHPPWHHASSSSSFLSASASSPSSALSSLESLEVLTFYGAHARNNLKRVTSCWRKKVTHVRLAECFTDSIVHGRDIRFCLF